MGTTGAGALASLGRACGHNSLVRCVCNEASANTPGGAAPFVVCAPRPRRSREVTRPITRPTRRPCPISPPLASPPSSSMVSKRKRSMVPADDSSAAASDPADAEPAPPTAECPFTVEYRSSPSRRNLPYISDSGVKVKRAKKASTPAKPGPGGAPVLPPEQQLDQTPPEDQPTVYSVKPKGKWEALKKYRNFVGTCAATVVARAYVWWY